MENERIIQTGDAAGPPEPRSVIVNEVLSEISRLYFARAEALRSGDREAFLEVDVKITSLKDKLASL